MLDAAQIQDQQPRPLSRRGRRPGSKVRFVGLVRDAQSLGVSVSHLWRCLSGSRSSPLLVAKYTQLKASQSQPPAVS